MSAPAGTAATPVPDQPKPPKRPERPERADTAEADWTAWGGLDTLPETALPTAGPVVILAAHPDDETLAAGGILHRLGRRAQVVLATDGEAAYEGVAGLADRRIAELGTALDRLGLAGIPVTRLGLPDRGVAEHTDRLVERLVPLLTGAALLLAPYRRDGHRDHDACGRAAVEAARATGTRLLEYPLWAWHWTAPGDAALPWPRASRVVLTDAEWRAKQHALAAYASQLDPAEPILPEPVLAHFRRRCEVVFG